MTTLAAVAQEKKDSIYLYGSVADSFTKASVPDVLLTLMKTDSTMVDTVRVYKRPHAIILRCRANRCAIYFASNILITKRPLPTLR